MVVSLPLSPPRAAGLPVPKHQSCPLLVLHPQASRFTYFDIGGEFNNQARFEPEFGVFRA
jgi:hypothetical protein